MGLLGFLGFLGLRPPGLIWTLAFALPVTVYMVGDLVHPLRLYGRNSMSHGCMHVKMTGPKCIIFSMCSVVSVTTVCLLHAEPCPSSQSALPHGRPVQHGTMQTEVAVLL